MNGKKHLPVSFLEHFTNTELYTDILFPFTGIHTVYREMDRECLSGRKWEKIMEDRNNRFSIACSRWQQQDREVSLTVSFTTMPRKVSVRYYTDANPAWQKDQWTPNGDTLTIVFNVCSGSSVLYWVLSVQFEDGTVLANGTINIIPDTYVFDKPVTINGTVYQMTRVANDAALLSDGHLAIVSGTPFDQIWLYAMNDFTMPIDLGELAVGPNGISIFDLDAQQNLGPGKTALVLQTKTQDLWVGIDRPKPDLTL